MLGVGGRAQTKMPGRDRSRASFSPIYCKGAEEIVGQERGTLLNDQRARV